MPTRDLRPPEGLDAAAVVSGLRHGPADPMWRRGPDGRHWWATETPSGPGLLTFRQDPTGLVRAQAWGDGADWLLDGLPDLVGVTDDPSGFRPDPAHRVLTETMRHRGAPRVPRSRRVADAFAAACLEQRVTGSEAFAGWRRLVLRHGEPAPGEPARPGGPAHGMRCAPTPQAWRAIPSGEWLAAGADSARRIALLAGMRVAGSLERTLDRPFAEADVGLRSLPRVGVWTSAEVRQRAHGDPDAFSFADYHVSADVGYALTGQVTDDDACAALIACYAGHRWRVQRLVEWSGVARPRRGPRRTLPSHLPRG